MAIGETTRTRPLSRFGPRLSNAGSMTHASRGSYWTTCERTAASLALVHPDMGRASSGRKVSRRGPTDSACGRSSSPSVRLFDRSQGWLPICVLGADADGHWRKPFGVRSIKRWTASRRRARRPSAWSPPSSQAREKLEHLAWSNVVCALLAGPRAGVGQDDCPRCASLRNYRLRRIRRSCGQS